LLVVDDDPRYAQWLGHHLGVFCPDSTVTILNLASFERWCETDSGRDCDILLLTAPFGSSPEDPKARGLELLRQLRGRPVFPAVISLAEDGNELTAVRAMQLGAVDYLPKRLLTPERLSTSVRLALRRIEKRVQRKLQSLAHVTDVAAPHEQPKEQKLDHERAAETWASMTLTPAVAPKASSAKAAAKPEAPSETDRAASRAKRADDAVSENSPVAAAPAPERHSGESAVSSHAASANATSAGAAESNETAVAFESLAAWAAPWAPATAPARPAATAPAPLAAPAAAATVHATAASGAQAAAPAHVPASMAALAAAVAAEAGSPGLAASSAAVSAAVAAAAQAAAAAYAAALAAPPATSAAAAASSAAAPTPTAATPTAATASPAPAASEIYSSDEPDTNSANATQLMAPGQLEAILNAASAAALKASDNPVPNKVLDTSFTGSIVTGPLSKDAKSPARAKSSGMKRTSTPAPPVTAEFIPGYIIKMKIGESEKAVVYLATSISLGANVALKVSKTLRDDAAGRQFLEREYTAIIAIRDPLVVQIYDYGVHAGFEYLAMEYLLRGDLKARMQAGLKEVEALRYVDQIAAALRVVHNAGLLHRDLKPPNVMLRDNDEVALIDFGLARALDGSTPSTRTGVLRGSPYYMSPEQALGEILDARSDFYSLGIMFYEMLTGRKPYTGATAMEVLQQHVNSPLPPLPHSLARYEPFLHKLAAKNRNERFSKAEEIIAAIAELRAAMAADVQSAVA
jgi:DNA-binding response OmpR family regulator